MMLGWLSAIANWSVLAFGFLLFLLQIGVYEVGYQIGCRRAARMAPNPEVVGTVVGGMLGLLAFVLALTLSFANNSFSERRQGTLEEANAIGTAWLRAEAIGGPRGGAIAQLLEQYIQLRIDFVQESNQPDKLADLNQRTSAMQTEIWGHAIAITQQRTDPVVVSLMSALNDAFDMTTKARFAYTLLLPPQLVWLLLGMTLMSMGALGYQVGLRGSPNLVLAATLTLMWTIVIVNILDLATPRVGSIRTGAAVYEWTLRSFQGGVPIPPLPAGK